MMAVCSSCRLDSVNVFMHESTWNLHHPSQVMTMVDIFIVVTESIAASSHCHAASGASFPNTSSRIPSGARQWSKHTALPFGLAKNRM